MSAKMNQILIIEPPNELAFYGPFTSAVTSSMKLKNPSDRKVCFKIKTTAPKKYCVKPNSGVVDPSSEVQIAVSLQPFEYDPLEKNKHKFMVQSMFAPEGEIDQDKLWKEADQMDIMDSKLKCVFMMPNSETNNSGDIKLEGKMEASRPVLAQAALPKGGDPEQLNAAVVEIKRMNEAMSQLRQENLLLKEETMRLKRIAAASEKPDSSSYSSTTVTAVGATGEGISTLYIYAALIILIVGMILGKFFL